MNTIEKAKDIVALFIKIEPAAVTDATIIDNNALHSSVLIHRMYATLAKEGMKVENPQEIKTFGDLIDILSGAESGGQGSGKPPLPRDLSLSKTSALSGTDLSIGVDIEDVDSMPHAKDYREEEFYTRNFSSREISYCVLQPNIRGSFAGKFAAKEAVVKADNSFKGAAFKDIEILNNSDGKPSFNGFAISISHTEKQVVAAAVIGGGSKPPEKPLSEKKIQGLIDENLSKIPVEKHSKRLPAVAILISLAAICLAVAALIL